MARLPDIDVREREAECLVLRRDGKSYQEIADTVGYKSADAAWKAVKRALNAMIEEPSKEVMALEIARLDRLTEILAPRISEPGAAGLEAQDRYLKVMKRRAELLGLDAPNRGVVDITGVMKVEWPD